MCVECMCVCRVPSVGQGCQLFVECMLSVCRLFQLNIVCVKSVSTVCDCVSSGRQVCVEYVKCVSSVCQVCRGY